jgi:hypothetical protein
MAAFSRKWRTASRAAAPGLIVLALVFGAALAGCDSGGEESPPNNPPDIAKNITVYMEKPSGWDTLYAYVWDDNGSVYTAGSPGAVMNEAGDGFFSYSVKAEYGYINVKFSGGNGNTTADILGVDSDTYYQTRFSGQNGVVYLNAAASPSDFASPSIRASEVTDSTVTLEWTAIPEADGYVLYDEWSEYDDDDEIIEGTEWWHFQKLLSKDETSLYDDNYGEYLLPEKTYTWRVVAVQFKPDADFSEIEEMDEDDIDEDVYSQTYTAIYDFGKFEQRTQESSLAAPTLTASTAGATSIRLDWNAIEGADYYEVYWKYEGDNEDIYPDNEWHYVADAETNFFVDEDEAFIYPLTEYSYSVAAVNERVLSKDSNEVTVTTPADSPANALRSIAPPLRAVTPQKPSRPSAEPILSAANQAQVTWTLQGSGISYYVGVFANSSSTTPVWTSPKQTKGSLVLKHKDFSGKLSGKLDFYVKVQAFASTNSANKSAWSDAVLTTVFPDGFGKTKITPNSSSKTLQITLKDVFAGKFSGNWDYGYKVTYTDIDKNKNSVEKKVSMTKSYATTLTNVPATSKYQVSIVPYIGDYYWAGKPIK